MSASSPAVLQAFASFAFTLLMAFMCSEAIARSYAAAPFSGRVVDAETGAPIAGVIVLAQWIVEGPMEAHPVAAMQIMETVTDENGRYSFPGWGPKSVPRPDFWSWVFTPALSTKDPQLFFMKSGYAHVYERNDFVPGKGSDAETELRRSQLDGKDVALQDLRGDLHARRQDFDRLMFRPYGLLQADCSWTKMPLTITFLFSERQDLKTRGETPDMSEFINVRACGEPAWVRGLPK